MSKYKVGIITKIGKNYGALLQAYALKTAFCKQGAEAHIIKYTPDISRNSYKVCRHTWGRRGAVANIKAFLHGQSIKESTKKFLQFREKYFDFIGKGNNVCELEKTLPACDIYVSGSDQVWNPVIAFDESFYYQFSLRAEKPYIVSYAASIGLKSIPQQYKERFKQYVSRFNYISVREKQASALLKNLGISSCIAPDPTLLLTKSEWDTLKQDTFVKGKYILCYCVSYVQNTDKVVNKVKDILNLPVVNLMTSEDSSHIGDIKIRNAGPEEFLGLFANASYVVTTSFHGTVFSVHNKVPFCTLLYKQTGGRVSELLENIELGNRIVCDESEINDSFVKCHQIYSDTVIKRIEALRQAGYNVLTSILNKESI